MNISRQSGGAEVIDGEELEEITTRQLGFTTINGEIKARLFAAPWPDPPMPSAQLLSVASSQSILAAAGPDNLVVVSTDEVRKVLSETEGDDIRDVKPLVSVPHSRLEHVAFSSDDSVLVVSDQSGSGLIAYQVDKLKTGQAEPALKIATDRVALRTLVPNPNPQFAHLFAAVNKDGGLVLADLSKGQLVQGVGGSVLRSDVVCLSWSNRGKQLVAGCTDGTAVQMKPDGTVVTHIPKSTLIAGNVHISGVSWLEDDTFFLIYTPNDASAESGIPPSDYYIVERQNKTNFTFHKLPEVLPLFGMERLPSYHFIARLRKFDPHITDLLLLSATTATDVGIISKTSEPISSEDPVVHSFTLTSVGDDSRRAVLPLSSESLDTSPIGMAIDLSSKQTVINPIPSNPEIQETAGPVPNLLVLNNEGTLCSWWIIYDDSITAKTTYSGFDSLKKLGDIRSAASPPAEAASSPISSEPASTTSASKPSAVSPFGASSTTNGSSSSLGRPTNQSAFGTSNPQQPTQPQLQSGFGTGASFGTTSKIGEDKPSWTSTGFGGNKGMSPSSGPTFGQSSFGQPSFGTPSTVSNSGNVAFGSTTSLSARPSTLGQGTSPTPAFGQTGFGAKPASGPFATAGSSTTTSGFASFAGSGGFGTTKQEANQSSPFAKPIASSGFGQASSAQSPFAKASGSTAFGQTTNTSPFAKAPSSNTFGQTSTSTFGKPSPLGAFGSTTTNTLNTGFGSSTPFKIDSSFKGDGTAKNDLPAPAGGVGFGFGSGFSNLLGDSSAQLSPTKDRETEMGDSDESESEVAADKTERVPDKIAPEMQNDKNGSSKPFTTPPSTITQPKTTPAPPVSSLFGNVQQQTTTPQQAFNGSFPFESTTPQETPAASRTMFGTNPLTAPTPAKIEKSEPIKTFDAFSKVQTPSAKASNDTEKDEETPKIITESPSDEEAVNIKKIPSAPLPPDPVSKPGYTTGDTSASSARSKESDDAPLPPDFLPANRSVVGGAENTQLPPGENDSDDGEDEFSSDFEGSGEDVTQDVSPVEGPEDHEDDTTERIETSPESSFKTGDTTSPTGGLFTKVSTNDTSRLTRPLFGEVGRAIPSFPPPNPKIQQSPRSPSPVRQGAVHDVLRSENRSVSAPVRPRSAIDQRKTDYSQSTVALQAAKAREEEAHREKIKQEALKLASEQAKTNEMQSLEDDEDELLQQELALPVEPSEGLDSFITYQAGSRTPSSKKDIPAQIERLYQDINSMVYTLGINARSLSSFMLFQENQREDLNWPGALQSDAPLDALNEKWRLADISRLHEGSTAFEQSVEKSQAEATPKTLEDCQDLLTRELFDLRTKIVSIRKSLRTRTHGSSTTAPLSAEQASIQHDLRKTSASVQTKLAQIEDTLAVIRARLAEVSPSENLSKSMSSGQTTQKKPTVEAVTNTVIKMTSMAEKKSADIDVLEAQLKKLDLSLNTSRNGANSSAEIGTPERSQKPGRVGSPSSPASSVFYTPESKAAGSVKSTRTMGISSASLLLVSAEDKERWQVKARRKKEVAASLKSVLEAKRKTASSST